MRLEKHVQLLKSSLRRPPYQSLLFSRCSSLCYSTSASEPRKEIGVLGGGITGLSTAYYVSKQHPQARITIYDAEKRVGGWLQSRHVDVPGGEVLFESGPRTLRPGPNAYPTARLIQELGLVDDVIYTAKDAPSARNRFIYYPDRLVKMPGPGMSAWEMGAMVAKEEVFKGLIWGGLREWFNPKRPSSVTDESVGSFIARRTDKRPADNLVSAVMHGIYAGDIWQLSAKTLLPLQWRLEGQFGGIFRGLYALNSGNNTPGTVLQNPRDAVLSREMSMFPLAQDFSKALNQASVFTFRNGLQQLGDQLEETLENNPNVSFHTSARITKLERKDNKVQLTLGDEGVGVKDGATPDMVISTLPVHRLNSMLGGAVDFPTPVTVMVVNLFFSNPNLLPVEGFGYLIPQSVPFQQNPERALGVIFDSDAVKGQDTVEGTKVTVMMGGHWWDGWSAFPTEEEGVEMARSILARHLGIKDEPAATRASLQHECIPQYTVGHEDRLRQFHHSLVRLFRGKVRVAGNSYTGVGVNDCIRGARDVAESLDEDGWDDEDRTGLNHLFDDRPWVLARMREE